jgi:hypothetical protein
MVKKIEKLDSRVAEGSTLTPRHGRLVKPRFAQ